MISKDTSVVYAQYHEDTILAALLSEVKKGFYVDVGANHEGYHSVTKYFYKRGWSGINVEPIPRLIAEFKKNRKKDVNLQLAVSNETGELELRDYPEYDGLSTLSADSKSDPSKVDLPHQDYKVRVDSLKNIFTEHEVTKIDFLKIDVEGYEFEVLRSNDWSKFRPTVVCIEANHRLKDWSKYLEQKNYTCVIFDGLNEYYLASESKSLFENFAERAALLSHNALRNHQAAQWQLDLDRITFLESFTERQDVLIKSTQVALENAAKELEELHRTSFKHKSYLHRLQLAITALTIDYIRQQKKSNTKA